MPDYTRLMGITDLAKDALRVQLERNLVAYFTWAFLEAGAFTNVGVRTPGTADPYGDEVLYPLQKDGSADGTVWQSRHANWCWESGLESGLVPTVCTGVYVNGTLHPTSSTTGAYAHRLDFRNGRVVFSSAVPTTSVVQAGYSYRWFGLYDQSVPWFRPVVRDAFLTEQSGQGSVLQVLDDYRVSTPLAVAEAAMRSEQRGYQLGSNAKWVRQDVLFHVVAQDKGGRDQLADALTLQQGHEIFLFDTNARRAAGQNDLDAYGSPVAGAMTYPQLVQAYTWKKAFFARAQGSDVSGQLPLFRGTARLSVEVDFTSV